MPATPQPIDHKITQTHKLDQLSPPKNFPNLHINFFEEPFDQLFNSVLIISDNLHQLTGSLLNCHRSKFETFLFILPLPRCLTLARNHQIYTFYRPLPHSFYKSLYIVNFEQESLSVLWGKVGTRWRRDGGARRVWEEEGDDEACN